MSYRSDHPKRRIIDVTQESMDWQDTVGLMADANAYVETSVAALGVDGFVEQLNRQGFDGEAHRFRIQAFHAECAARRAEFEAAQVQDEG